MDRAYQNMLAVAKERLKGRNPYHLPVKLWFVSSFTEHVLFNRNLVRNANFCGFQMFLAIAGHCRRF